MPKTFPIRLEVEEIALGPVLRKLNDMPGIVDLHLDLGHGGNGSGRKQLEEVAAAKQNRGNNEQVIIKMLMNGPAHLNALTTAIGGKKTSAYTVMSKLKKQALVENAGSKGLFQLTAQAKAQLGGTLTLSAPAPTPKVAKIKHGPKGRAVPGSGNIVLRELLADGPKAPIDLRNEMAGKGMSPKSISGVLQRAKDASLIKKNGTGYELTAKGLKIDVPVEAAANG